LERVVHCCIKGTVKTSRTDGNLKRKGWRNLRTYRKSGAKEFRILASTGAGVKGKSSKLDWTF